MYNFITKSSEKKGVYYAYFDGGFDKSITRFRLWYIKHNMKRLYSRFDKYMMLNFVPKKKNTKKTRMNMN